MTAFILKKKLNVPNSSSNELNDIRSVCQKMRKSLQNITPLLSTEQAFKHSDVFLHPLYPTTAPAFTLLEGTDASASKLCILYETRRLNEPFRQAVLVNTLLETDALAPRLLPITSFSPNPPLRPAPFPRALTEKSPGLMTQCVTR